PAYDHLWCYPLDERLDLRYRILLVIDVGEPDCARAGIVQRRAVLSDENDSISIGDNHPAVTVGNLDGEIQPRDLNIEGIEELSRRQAIHDADHTLSDIFSTVEAEMLLEGLPRVLP